MAHGTEPRFGDAMYAAAIRPHPSREDTQGRIDQLTESLCRFNCDAESSCDCAAHQLRALLDRSRGLEAALQQLRAGVLEMGKTATAALARDGRDDLRALRWIADRAIELTLTGDARPQEKP